MPFNNMQELSTSDYKFMIEPGSYHWDAFKYGDELWKKIYKEKLEPFEEDYKSLEITQKEWLMSSDENAVFSMTYAFG